RADLTTIVKLAAMDIDLDVPDPLHRFLSGRRPPHPDESLDALLELAVLLEQLLDTARQMLWLRLENGSRPVDLPLELANERVGEAQPLEDGHGPLLAHMRTGDLPQARVYEVRRRVVALDVLPPPLVHLGNRGSRRELVLEMPDDGARAVHLLYVGHLQLPPFPLHPPRIPDLPARLSLERLLLPP